MPSPVRRGRRAAEPPLAPRSSLRWCARRLSAQRAGPRAATPPPHPRAQPSGPGDSIRSGGAGGGAGRTLGWRVPLRAARYSTSNTRPERREPFSLSLSVPRVCDRVLLCIVEVWSGGRPPERELCVLVNRGRIERRREARMSAAATARAVCPRLTAQGEKTGRQGVANSYTQCVSRVQEKRRLNCWARSRWAGGSGEAASKDDAWRGL